MKRSTIAMKPYGIAATLTVCLLLVTCGCIQIIINPPGLPGSGPETPTPVPLAEKTVAEAAPAPAQVTASTSQTTVPAPPTDSRFIVPIGDPTKVGHRTFTFNYGPDNEGSQVYTFRVPVNMSVLYGARQMKITVPANSMNPQEIRDYIDTFESDPAMEELYDSVLTQLRTARYHNGDYLTDDEYLELIVAFVQQIPCMPDSSSRRKYPVEVIWDKAGDSDEKSLLLANLLAREGYDVSLMVFEDLQYETTGIRIVQEVPDSSLKAFTDGKKEYIFVDACSPRFIGSVPDKPVDFAVADDPAIYPVGAGTKSYGPVNYVWKVVADLKRLRDEGKLTSGMMGHEIKQWDKTGTCSWIKNSKLLNRTICYCCDL
ncbi:MAG: hypothetical protein GYA23_11475 [Methanomicrobiales archaeon]|nr:hypothetical protein [Methanomicrobiales archaeon]